ncbi:MAG: VTT domain-containing protein [Clostridiales Family XIII bacterium]|jgi:uncharacterized membrane protein YdjX (TVP38/TMEM64 family)|nr:VTT domain-containing protein [Clostridiales Family XIII bacterium]
MRNRKKTYLSLITLVFIVGLIVLLCVALIPILVDIFHNQDGRGAIEIIHAHGIRGIPVLACLQALQVITTVVPALLIQIPAGLVYGTWNGLMICLLGAVLGNMIVFVALRQFSATLDHVFPKRRKKREEKAANPKKKGKLPFFLNPESLNRMPHPELVAFYVYMIPGIPNGVLPHIFARTKVSFGRYLVAVAAGNAPSTLVCTLVGDRLASGDYRGAIIIILVFTACICGALLLRRKLITLISGGYSLRLGSSNNNNGAETVAPMVNVEAGVPVGSHAENPQTEAAGIHADDAGEEVAVAANATGGAGSSKPKSRIPNGWRILKGKKGQGTPPS